MSACVIISKCKISKFLPDSVKLFKFHVIFLYIQTVLNTFLPQETDDYNFSQKSVHYHICLGKTNSVYSSSKLLSNFKMVGSST